MCMEGDRISLRMQIVSILFKISKSLFFNLSCIAIGFILGYQFFQNRQYIKFVQTQDIECIEKIHSILKQHMSLNEQMSEEFEKLKVHISN